ncbi:DUF6053 domain-containing protein [Lysobacter enzymogenes]|uniref:DUF6053 domain-containing protein n=1 Tax=Lysobacter enzymogenes TaxID=69 RepID=UPI003D2F5BD2
MGGGRPTTGTAVGGDFVGGTSVPTLSAQIAERPTSKIGLIRSKSVGTEVPPTRAGPGTPQQA